MHATWTCWVQVKHKRWKLQPRSAVSSIRMLESTGSLQGQFQGSIGFIGPMSGPQRAGKFRRANSGPPESTDQVGLMQSLMQSLPRAKKLPNLGSSLSHDSWEETPSFGTQHQHPTPPQTRDRAHPPASAACKDSAPPWSPCLQGSRYYWLARLSR